MASSSQPQARFYRPELDGLRFFAFFLVFVHHSLPHRTDWWLAKGFPSVVAAAIGAATRTGAYGVDLFFALSAYLITELLLREKEATGVLNAKAFLARRALRIWPLFFAFLGIAFVADRLLFKTHGMPVSEIAAFAVFLGNWSSALRGFSDSVAAALWSVSIEEQFYLLWPFVVRKLSARQIASLALVMIAGAAVSRLALVQTGLPHPLVWCSTFGRLDSIGCGVLLAIGLRSGAIREFSSPVLRMCALVGALGAWWGLEAIFPVDTQSIGRLLLGYPVVAMTAGLMVWAAIGPGVGPLRLLQTRTLVYLGQISYGLYVYHVMALRLGAMTVGAALPKGVGVIYIVPAFFLCIAISAASYRWLEGPFLKLKRRFTVVESRQVS